MKNIPFKQYSPNQIPLLPADLGEKVPQNHPVRIVDRIIEQIDLTSLYAEYKGGGTSSYHPVMMLKVLIYAYLENIYSSRKIEEALHANIYFMWLSAGNYPDHNSINRFRSSTLKSHIKTIFSQIVQLLVKEGLVDIKEVYLDGTKIEANANKYSFVWRKSIAYNKKRMVKQLEELWEYAEQQNKQESQNSKPDFSKLTDVSVQAVIDEINSALKECDVDKKVKAKIRYAKKNWPHKLKQYEEQEMLMGERNSLSKTDTDATFMRLKDDHMQNGQLKAAYNLQISTNNQIIVNYTVEQKPTDTTALKNHVETFKDVTGKYPRVLTADAGYGSEENYDFMEKKAINAYVKYNYFHKEQKRTRKIDGFATSNLHYNKTTDTFTCPCGQSMQKIGSKKRLTSTGYEQNLTLYEAVNCTGCPMRSSCHKGKGNRRIEINHSLCRHKAKARELLLSEMGKYHRGRRCADVEGTFGILKQNKGFGRYMLRGLEKVEIETGIVAIAHNMKKISKMVA